jgi:hypothetical protein
MKKQLILILLALLASGTKAQTVAEWTRQKETRRQYLLEQILALQMYRGYVETGYSIAQIGLATIGKSKEGEFRLHQEFFGSLKRVNPKIRNYAKVADIIILQVKIMQVYKSTHRQVKESNALEGDEISYINRVFGRMIDGCTTILEELLAVTTKDKLEMKDDERLKRIDNLYKEMQDKYMFAQNFGREAQVLAASRLQERKDVQTSRAINGIKNQ